MRQGSRSPLQFCHKIKYHSRIRARYVRKCTSCFDRYHSVPKYEDLLYINIQYKRLLYCGTVVPGTSSRVPVVPGTTRFIPGVRYLVCTTYTGGYYVLLPLHVLLCYYCCSVVLIVSHASTPQISLPEATSCTAVTTTATLGWYGMLRIYLTHTQHCFYSEPARAVRLNPAPCTHTLRSKVRRYTCTITMRSFFAYVYHKQRSLFIPGYRLFRY